MCIRDSRQAQLVRSDGDRAGADQNHLMAHVLQIGQCPCQDLNIAQIRCAGRMRDRRRADLDHDPLLFEFHFHVPPFFKFAAIVSH